MDVKEPACWLWDVTEDDIADAENCPENFGHIFLWNWQRAHCAICGTSVTDNGRLRRDHDHKTGLLRGLLCTRCNSLEGLAAWAGVPGASAGDPRGGGRRRTFERWQVENATLIERMKWYRSVNPASRLGMRVRHEMTIAPKGIRLPLAYSGPLPIVRMDGRSWQRLYEVTHDGRTAEHRVDVLMEFLDWYECKPGAKLPKRPDARV